MRKLFLSTLAAAVAVTTACGGDSSTGPGATVAGTYTLQTVNSKTLPFVLYDDGTQKIEVISDVYNISAGGTYTNQTVVRTTAGGTASTDTLSSNGTYKQSGNSLTLTDAADSTDQVTGTLSGSTFTINVEGVTLVYTRG
jgi:hypothetical protein